MSDQPQEPPHRFTPDELAQIARFLDQRAQVLPPPEPPRKSLGTFGEGVAVGLVLALGIAIAWYVYVSNSGGQVTLSFH